MRDRASLRQEFARQTEQAEQRKQFKEQIARLEALEDTFVEGFNALLKFLDGKTTKTEVINQLTEIGTPDVAKVVKSLEKLQKVTEGTKLDITPVTKALEAVREQIKAIPETKFEQKDSVKVENLDEIVFDTTQLEKAIKALKLDVKVEPKVNVEKPDLRPLQEIMLDLLKAFNKFKIEPTKEVKVSNLKEIKPVDTTKIEKKLDKSNELLKEITEKRFGGGGGGGGESTLPFPLYADKTISIVKVGAIKTITETDGTKTLTTIVDATDPNNKTITEEWS